MRKAGARAQPLTRRLAGASLYRLRARRGHRPPRTPHRARSSSRQPGPPPGPALSPARSEGGTGAGEGVRAPTCAGGGRSGAAPAPRARRGLGLTDDLQGELGLHRAALAPQRHAVLAAVLPAGAGQAQPGEAVTEGHLGTPAAAAVHLRPVLPPGGLDGEAALEGDLHGQRLPGLDHQRLLQPVGHFWSDDGRIWRWGAPGGQRGRGTGCPRGRRAQRRTREPTPRLTGTNQAGGPETRDLAQDFLTGNVSHFPGLGLRLDPATGWPVSGRAGPHL